MSELTWVPDALRGLVWLYGLADIGGGDLYPLDNLC